MTTTPLATDPTARTVRLRRLGIDTYQEPTIYMRADSPVCRAEGFEARSRVHLQSNGRSIVATLNIVDDHMLGALIGADEAGLSEVAWRLLGASEHQRASLSHPRTLESLAEVRAKLYGHRLSREQYHAVLSDVVAGRYADVHIATFLAACAANTDLADEIADLSLAMIDVGDRLSWDHAPIVDKHCVGGLPGNRTTPLVVAIVCAYGLTMPKTSSRAITSPAGTADTMETLTNVDLSLDRLRQVVEQEGGCMAWGGAVHLSPADDALIRVERAMDIDTEAQLIASVLSKKVAAGSSHVVIDIPTGPTAKVRTMQAAQQLSQTIEAVAERVGLQVRCVITDGTQPIGRGIGPALEARDVLAVLDGASDAPSDLRDRAVRLAGAVLELSQRVDRGEGAGVAAEILGDGRAKQKFEAICQAQGGLREPPVAPYRHEIVAPREGVVTEIDLRRLARLAKFAGAPSSPSAGLEFHAPLGRVVSANEPLVTLHAEAPGELAFAVEYARTHPNIIRLSEEEET